MKRLLRSIVVAIITLEAKLVLKKYRPKIVGITGAVGKTSMKEGVALALSSSFSVHKSQKSYNSEIGVPLAILMSDSGWGSPLSWLRIVLEGAGLVLFPNEYPEWLVLELGVDHPGDMQRHVSWLKLDVAVLGRVGEVPVHVEFFDSPEAVLREKARIISGLKKGGRLVYIADDKNVEEIVHTYKVDATSFGYHKNAAVRATYERLAYRTRNKIKYPAGFSFKIDYENDQYPVKLEGVFGAAATYAVLCGFAVSMTQQLNPESVAQRLCEYEGVSGRMRVLEGNKNTTIIDDTYNSSPAALALALGHVEQLKHANRKIAVLGDMLELGSYSPEAHREAGELTAEIADIAYFVGNRMKFARDAYVSKKGSDETVRWFSSSREAGKALDHELLSGDVVLVKGSQGLRTEQVVEEIMANPDEKFDLLVRQEGAWKAR